MREQLVQYLLGELDEQEARAVEERAERDPQIRKQLEHLRTCLALEETCCETDELSGDDAQPEEPPAGLADRVADSVHDLAVGLSAGNIRPMVSSATNTVQASDALQRSSRSSWSLVDGAVAAGVIMAVGMMLLPALASSRDTSRRLACENNMRQLGYALQQYANDHDGLFPHVHPGENAGIFSVRLADGDYLDRKELPRLVVCPASRMAEQMAAGRTIVIPTSDQLNTLRGRLLAQVRASMGGNMAYRLGFVEGPLYRPVKNCESSRSPMLSDEPTLVSGSLSTGAHGCGDNVWFQDGSVRFRRTCMSPAEDDNIYVNRQGKPAAGQGWNDAVLVKSSQTPGVLPASYLGNRPAAKQAVSTRGTTRQIRGFFFITPR